MGPKITLCESLQLQYKYYTMVLAVLLNKTKPHYSEGRTMQIRTIRGPPVVNRKLVFLKILLETFEYSLVDPPLPWNLFFCLF